MIFVMFGTQKQQFSRLLNMLEDSKELENEEVIAQTGYTNVNTNKLKSFDFATPDIIDDYINNAEYVIVHGGAGSIFNSLKKGKKILAVPRLSEFNEHINNHQVEICTQLDELEYLLCYKKYDNIDVDIKKLKQKKFKSYISNKEYLNVLRKEI